MARFIPRLGIAIGWACWSAVSCHPNDQAGPDEAALRRFHITLADLRKDFSEKGEVTREGIRESGVDSSTDGILTKSIEKRLYNDPDVPAFLITVTTTGCRVTLTGRVGAIEQLQKAMLLSLTCPGVLLVTAKLTIEADDGSGAIKGEADAKRE